MVPSNKLSSSYFLKKDLNAGLVVSLVALPLCLGIALASGAPLFSGLIAGIIGGLIVGFSSGSPLSVTGPAAGLTAVVFSSIQSLGSFQHFLAAVVLAGVFQIILGLLKAGRITSLFPSSVINGMLTGIGIIIMYKQVKYAVGFNAIAGQNWWTHVAEGITPTAVVVTLLCLGCMILWEEPFMKRFRVIPGALAAVLLGVLCNWIVSLINPSWQLLGDKLVNVPVASDVSGFLSQFTLPNFSMLANSQLWVVAATLAIVASIETLLCIDAVDRLDAQRRTTPANRELLAQGLGNVVSGFIGGLPITSVIVRSSANVNAGAQTKLSTIVHGTLLLLCVAFIPVALNKIPLASLAAVLLLTGWKLAKPQTFKMRYNLGMRQFLPFMTTVVVMLWKDLLVGVGAGLAVSVIFVLFDHARSGLTREVNETEKSYTIHLPAHTSFLTKALLATLLSASPAGYRVSINARRCEEIDPDVLETIENYNASNPGKIFIDRPNSSQLS
jgi:MFS superfamily sulfate permease-like transporter